MFHVSYFLLFASSVCSLLVTLASVTDWLRGFSRYKCNQSLWSFYVTCGQTYSWVVPDRTPCEVSFALHPQISNHDTRAYTSPSSPETPFFTTAALALLLVRLGESHTVPSQNVIVLLYWTSLFFGHTHIHSFILPYDIFCVWFIFVIKFTNSCIRPCIQA